MKEKIVHLMKSEGLTSSRLAEILEIQPSGISHILSGRNKPSFDLLQKILRRFPRINPDWLLLDSPTVYRADFDASIDGVSSGAAASSGEGSLPIDLFGLGEMSASNFASNAGGNLPPEINLLGTPNLSQNSAQNQGRNLNQNGAQNGSQNTPQNRQNLGGVQPSVQRIIVLYSDGTFSTYNAR